MLIRGETPGDLASIRQLNQAVFGGNYEADLVDNLRTDNLVLVSLVAVTGKEIVGHICFSRLPVEVEGRMVQAASLAPVVVRATHQRLGIGSRLIIEGLDILRAGPTEAVIVLGHPKYYPRFGFSPELTRNLASPFQGKEAFMGLELTPGALLGSKGSVTYPKAFGL